MNKQKAMFGTIKESEENKAIISLRKYYKQMGICSCVGGLLWCIYGILDKNFLNIIKGETALNIIKAILGLGILLILSFCVNRMIITAAMKDKEDEMYMQTKAKTDAAFLNILFFFGCLMVAIPVILDGLKINVNGYFVSGIVWLIFSLYNFIGFYFEKKLNPETEEEE